MDESRQKSIGRRIRAAREEKGLTQEELGEKTGYSAMGISHFESGTRKIKIENLEKIAGALEVDINYLLEPITGYSPTTFYRRGEEEITEDQKRVEEEAVKKFEELVSSLEDEK